MNEQPSARKVLLAARSELARRLSELVLAAEEEVLADARGESYMNEIETLYEQVGIKLAHVNQMLAGLPADLEVEIATPTPTPSPSPASPPKPAAHTDDELGLCPSSSPPAPSPAASPAPAASPPNLPELLRKLRSPLGIPRKSIPSGLVVARKESPLKPLVSAPTSGQAPHLAIFAAQVRQGDLTAAGQTLHQMLGIDYPRAIACAAYFAEQLQEDPRLLLRIAQLQMELQASSFKGARLLLVECLGLTSEEAACVLYQSLPENKSKGLPETPSPDTPSDGNG